MRENVIALVEAAAETFALEPPIYEFGSYLVEDQSGLGDLRPLFSGKEFVGCDFRAGPGVDRIEDLARLSLGDASARTILCLETLEHVFEVKRGVEEMLRILAPGGTILISAPFEFRIHAYPGDYWRITPSCLDRLLEPLDAAITGSQGLESSPHTVFALGFRAPLPARFREAARAFEEGFETRLRECALRTPWQKRLKAGLLGWMRSKGERRRQSDHFRARFQVRIAEVPLDAGRQGPSPALGPGAEIM